VPFSGGICELYPGKPVEDSEVDANPFEWWFRPVKKVERVGEQSGGVPLGVRHAVVRQALHGRHLDPTTVGRPRGQAGVVVEHHQHVWCALGSAFRGERVPIGHRVADIEEERAMTAIRSTVSDSTGFARRTPCGRAIRAAKASGLEQRCATSAWTMRVVAAVGLVLLIASLLNVVLVLIEMA
jgi:hypothetical protein